LHPGAPPQDSLKLLQKPFKNRLSITILMMMPVIPRPANAPPLFGGKTVILFGGVNIEAMRRWQERVRAAKDDADWPSTDDASGKADAAGDQQMTGPAK
jgi:hypothetical protein